MKKYIGYDGHLFDSEAEAKASFQFARIGCLPYQQTFPNIFKDSEGTEFRAKSDFRHAGSSLYIEFKTYTLNGTKTKASADSQTEKRMEYRRIRGEAMKPIDRLKFQWNHARRKHAIVQKALTPQNYVVVFKKLPSRKDAMHYVKAGIIFTPFSALPSYLAYAKFAKLGLNVSFRLHYPDEEGGETVLTLH